MASRYQLVIFDCDGVLVDSERLATRIATTALAELGWAVSDSEFVERFTGRSEEFFRMELLRLLGDRVNDEWIDDLRGRYASALKTDLRAVEGVVEALDRVTTLSCVASSSNHDHIKLALQVTGLYQRFEGRIYSATDVANGKPAPDLFLHAAARLGVKPSACAVVEDSRYGVLAARAAGMRAFAFAGGVTPSTWLEGPDTVVFTDMRALPDLLAT